MSQSVITENTLTAVLANVSAVVNRELTEVEKALIEFAIVQIETGRV